MIMFLQDEQIFRLCPFDTWLADGETLTGTAAVVITDANGTPRGDMISDVALYGQTGIRYKITAIEVGYFTVRIDVQTTNGQKLGHKYAIRIIE